MLSRYGLNSPYLPPTFVEYKKRFIGEEVKEGLGYNLQTDIIIAEKPKIK